MYRARSLSAGWVCLLVCGTTLAAPPRAVELADLDGWDIVIAEDAIASEQYAAQELQRFVALAVGHTLPIVSSADREDRHFFVGPSHAMRESALGFSIEACGPEDLRIVVRDDIVVLAGGRPRGTLYAVYTLLEDYFGVRLSDRRPYSCSPSDRASPGGPGGSVFPSSTGNAVDLLRRGES